MAFEVFNRKAARITGEPMITIQKRGNFSLNAAAVAMLRRQDEKEDAVMPVLLLYNRDEEIVAIRRADRKDPNVYTIRKQANSASYLLAGTAFTKHYAIETDTAARRWSVERFDENTIGIRIGNDAAGNSRGNDDDRVQASGTIPWAGISLHEAVVQLVAEHPEWGFEEVRNHLIETNFDFRSKRPGNAVNMTLMRLRRGNGNGGNGG